MRSEPFDRRGRERGAGLVLIIGVVAALAISAAALVTLVGNVQHNSSDTRQHVKSFTVCEAGLDVGMPLLSSRWPATSTSIPVFDASAFRARFSTNQFPNPPSGPFITVSWYDNQDPVETAINWDQNGDGVLWMVSQANVGKRATRVVSLVQRNWFTMSLPRGIPLWAGGNLLSNGGGNNPKIRIEVPPPTGTVTTVHVGGTIEAAERDAGWHRPARRAIRSARWSRCFHRRCGCADDDRPSQRPLLHLAGRRRGEPGRSGLESDRRAQWADRHHAADADDDQGDRQHRPSTPRQSRACS